MKAIQTLMLLGMILLSHAVTAQTKNITLSNGSGWYRIISSPDAWATGTIRISLPHMNNRVTSMALQVAMIKHDQKGTVQILDNLHWNSNHVDSIRIGSIGHHTMVLDLLLSPISNPAVLTVTVDGLNMAILDQAVYNPAPPIGDFGIPGKVVGISSPRYPIYFSDRVGVGTRIIPSGYQFAVNGKGIMQELLIKQAGQWPDYVFDEEYRLIDLDGLAAYIREHKHLPSVPTAAQVDSIGINVGEMNRLLLEKVEELTLYLIQERKARLEMDKRISALMEGGSGK